MPSATTHLTRRVLGPADLSAVSAVLRASDLSVLGHTDFTDDELVADLRRDDLEAYGWYDGSALVGYGWVALVDGSNKVEIDAYVLPTYDGDLGVDLLDNLEARGRALAADAGHDSVAFDVGVYRQDERTRGWMAARGFAVATSFTRMRIDFDGAVPPVSSSVVVRRADSSEEDLRLVHDLYELSFTEHYGHVAASFERWRQRLLELGPDWAEVWLAKIDGAPAGILIGTRQFESDENAGYVRTLATLPSARGRGVGKALLRHYFDGSQRAGRAAVLLHVDVANVTGALAIYESVGMRPVLEIDAWTKRVPVSD